MRRGRLYLDDMGAELSRDLCCVGADVDGGLTLARQVAAAWIGPDYHSEPIRLRLDGHLGDVAHLVIGRVRARINRIADRRTAEPERVLDIGRNGLARILLEARHAVGVVELQDRRNAPSKGVGAGFEKAERCGISRKPSVESQLVMVMR